MNLLTVDCGNTFLGLVSIICAPCLCIINKLWACTPLPAQRGDLAVSLQGALYGMA
jgi:hypothetical protein